MKGVSIHILLLFLAFFCSAQSVEVDSLKSLLENTHEISKKIELNYKLSRRFHTIDPGKAKFYAQDALRLTEITGNEEFIGDIYRSLADIAIKQDSINLAKSYFLTASEIFRNQEDHSGLVSVITVLGNIELVSDQLSDAMQYYLEAIALAEQYDIKEIIPILYLNIGVVNHQFKSYGDAINNFSNALEDFIILKDSLNIGNAYYNIGSVYNILNDTSNALQYLEQARKIFSPIKNYDGLARCNFDLALLDMKKGDYKTAIEKIKLTIENINKKNVHYSAPVSTVLIPSYIAMGNCYFELEEYQLSERYFNKGLSQALLNNRISDIKDASEGLSKLWELKGNIDSSYHYYKIFKAYSDSLSNEDNIKQLAYLDASFKYDKRLNEEMQQRELESQKRRLNNLIFGLVIGGLLLVIVIMILFLKLWRTKLLRSELEQTKLKNELEIRNKELTTHVMYQVKKNEFILNISKKLQSSIYKLKPENRKLVEEVIRDLEMDSADDAWKEFEVRFHRVHADFNKKLLQKFPDLSVNELRLCAFLRLNMNTKEIAAITYQSTNSIDTARYRLRQKLGISKDDNLVGFLNQF